MRSSSNDFQIYYEASHSSYPKKNSMEPDVAIDFVLTNNLKVTQAEKRHFLLFDTKTDDEKHIIKVKI